MEPQWKVFPLPGIGGRGIRGKVAAVTIAAIVLGALLIYDRKGEMLWLIGPLGLLTVAAFGLSWAFSQPRSVAVGTAPDGSGRLQVRFGLARKGRPTAGIESVGEVPGEIWHRTTGRRTWLPAACEALGFDPGRAEIYGTDFSRRYVYVLHDDGACWMLGVSDPEGLLAALHAAAGS